MASLFVSIAKCVCGGIKGERLLVLVPFPVSVIKPPDRGNLKEKGSSLGSQFKGTQSIMLGSHGNTSLNSWLHQSRGQGTEQTECYTQLHSLCNTAQDSSLGKQACALSFHVIKIISHRPGQRSIF